MALPEAEQLRVDTLLGRLCDQRSIEGHVRLNYALKGCRVTLSESRPLFIDPAIWNEVKIAQFEYSMATLQWTLYWYDRKNRRQPYPTGRNRDTLERLICEVEMDPTGIFWE